MEHLRHLLPFVKRYRWQLLFGLICAAGSAVLTALIPQVLRVAVNELNDHGVVAGFGTYNGTSKCWILYPQCQN